jgi:predicted NBD/HSP70 family sugar kinase
MPKSKDIFDAAGVGIQTSDVRLTNQRVVMTLASTHPGSSAADLSRLSELAPQTVSAILQGLEQSGLLKPGEVIRGRRGQPATPYFVNPTGAYAIGIEIGWRHLEAVLVNIGGQTIGNYRRDYSFPDPRTMFNEVGAVVRQLCDRLPAEERTKIVALGVAAPSGIGRNVDLLEADPEMGRLWRELDVIAECERVTGLPVQLFNDGNAACWAELGAHPRPRPASFAYILIGTFVAAGIMAESILWEGPTGNSANLGSMLVTDRRGEQNFVHLLASIYGLERRLKSAGISVPQTTPLFWPWEQWEPHVSEWIEDASRALAKALLNTAAVIEFNYAIVDGVMPGAVLDRVIEGIKVRMAELPTLTFDAPAVAKGHLGGSAPSVGAAYLPLFRRYFSRDLSHLSESPA